MSELNAIEKRVLRVLVECMTEGLDQVSKRKTWERVSGEAPGKTEGDNVTAFQKAPELMEIPEAQFHALLNEGCIAAMAHQPSADYPEVNEDAAFVETQDFESCLSTHELMVIAQKQAIAHLKVLHNSFELRYRLAKRCNIKLVR